MNADPVKVGIVGTGFGVTAVGPALAAVPDMSITALCGRNPERLAEGARLLDVPFTTTDIGALCRHPDVDVVFVTTPPHVHREAVEAALHAERHVVCEKPFGRDLTDSLAMVRLALAAPALHFVDFEFRLEPARRALGDMIAGGELGEVRHVAITAMGDGSRFPVMNRGGWWQHRSEGGGWLGAMGSHYIDAVRTWFGEIDTVAGYLETRRPTFSGDHGDVEVSADDGFVLRMTTGSGVVCVIDSTSCVGASTGPRVEVYGAKRTAVLEDDRTLHVIDHDGTRDRWEFQILGADGQHPSQGALTAWGAEIATAVRTGAQTTPNFIDGLRVQEVITAAHQSHEQGGVATPVVRHH